MTETMHQPRMLRERPAADHCGVAPATMRNWRHQGRGPSYRKCGRTVLYDRAELDAWLEGLPTIQPREHVAA